MSQTNPTPPLHKVSIKRKPGAEGSITTGANTIIEVDGKPLQGCTFLKFELKPNRVGKLTIELIADVEVDELDLEIFDRSTPPALPPE